MLFDQRKDIFEFEREYSIDSIYFVKYNSLNIFFESFLKFLALKFFISKREFVSE